MTPPFRRDIVVASYNTHAGVGLDRRFVPQRISQVLSEIDADIVALQEIESRAGSDLLEILRARSGMHAVAGPAHRDAHSEFGNGLLTRFPVVSVERVALGVAGREPRCAIDAVLDCDGVALRLVTTHLGLRGYERRLQVRRLLDHLRARSALPTVLIGDVNEWPHGRALREVDRHFGRAPARASFPSLLPLLALDRIWVSPPALLRSVDTHRSRLSRLASDHLPLVARIAMT